MALITKVSALFRSCSNKLPTKKILALYSETANFPGARTKWTEKLKFATENSQTIPVYRILSDQGHILNSDEDPKLEPSTLQKMYKTMTLLNTTDKILYESQRQGRISFYLTTFGEEGILGSAVALSPNDLIYPQYRETVALLWRGYTVSEMINQCYGSIDDVGKGKQMPVAFGSKSLNVVTVTSPIATRMPQSVGAAYAFKGKNKVVVCYFGEGATSEGDAHAAFNFAATLECPVIFFCRNNGYAISTPTSEQYKGDGIAGKGPAYGMHSIRVDGNDVLAVYNATKLAREYSVRENKPVLIEALTYRVSHHSTSDDSTTYRSKEEVNEWFSKHNPITKFRLYLENNGLWNEKMEKEWLNEASELVKRTLEETERKKKPNWSEMFTDVYETMPDHIRFQEAPNLELGEPLLADLEIEIQNNEKKIELTGRRIVDIAHLFKAFQNVSHFSGFDCSLKNVEIISEKRLGLKSVFRMKCSMCNKIESLTTENESNINVNSSAVSGIIATGIGYTQFSEVCSSLDIPTMNHRTFLKYEGLVHNTVGDSTSEEILKAGKEEYELAKDAGEVNENGVPIITVIVDGAWSKRSYKTNYNASSGVACIIGARTKKILYVGVKNKFCCVCEKYKGGTVIEHICYKNWNSTSTSMESAIIVDGFKLSISMHGLIYGKFIGDGDSSVYKKIIEAQPYGLLHVQKIECRNHILRNYCNKIKELSKTPRTNMEIRSILKSVLKFRSAVTKAVQYRKQQNTDFHIKIRDLKEDILNGPKHIFGNHDCCKEYFCTGSKINEIDRYGKFKETALFEQFQTILHRVANNSSSLLHDLDTNIAESYNATINKFVGGKRINFSLKGSYQYRCLAAATNFNSKGHFLEIVQTNLNKGQVGKHTKEYCARISRKYRVTRKKIRRRKIIASEDIDYGLESPETEKIEDKNPDTYENLKQVFIKKFEDVDVIDMERKTIGQHTNPLWQNERRHRLTASKFGQVFNMRKTTCTSNLVKNILYTNINSSSVPSLNYGITNESTALQKFEEIFNLHVMKCGLFVDAANPFLAASPDGLVGCDAIVEIKCPYSARNMTVIDAVKQKIINYCILDDNEIFLKINHNYMHQIQGQLNITKRQKCYFVIYTQIDFFCQIISKDDGYWNNMLPSLNKFFFRLFYPKF